MTGWAQINGRDEITLRDKLRFDQEYFERQSLFFDLKIILLTVVAVVRVPGGVALINGLKKIFTCLHQGVECG